MKSLTKVLMFSFLLFLAGFTAVNEFVPEVETPKIEEETTLVNDVINQSSTVINYIDKGTMRASWYGPRFHGRMTANGETFDQEALTAAHRKLRFGTLLRLTNPENNRMVIVRINDRGPFIHGRHIDVSKAAAEELGMIQKGVTRLNVEQISLKGVNFPVISFN
ncbi:MAG TPA: septal ring lytic transglycosylase RlpA family protein [Ignavibacteriaceae bacterium]|nr:septal ring lytic transglycosylase RlpA family protein [Ignavibacteriaceae bacterium]